LRFSKITRMMVYVINLTEMCSKILSYLPLYTKYSRKGREFIYASIINGVINGYSLQTIKLMISQMTLESAFGDSKYAQDLNNLIGMRCVQVRKTTQIGCEVDVNFGIYKSPRSCAKDLILWYKSNDINKRSWNGALLGVIAGGYVTDEEEIDYVNALTNIHSSIGLTPAILAIVVAYAIPVVGLIFGIKHFR